MSHNGPSQADVIAAARSWVDTPYTHQASSLGNGADCLGVVRGVWRELYGSEPTTVPAYTPTWFKEGEADSLLTSTREYLIEKNSNHAPADVLVFRMVRRGPAKHMGIVTAHNRFVHAYAGRAVAENWLSDFWLARIAGIFSFPGVHS